MDLMYQSAKEHLKLWMRERGKDTVHTVVFHRDVMPELPAGSYAVVTVEIVSYERANPVVTQVPEYA